ncbi:YibE/F family protein [Paractinoplanes globisporus]|uniref:YibE/F family protein n=1 Tax=Paractinoplanes globisporus TaxID=113565 RepID=A0ABW6WWI6_9ACTN|nr:YibE/F family protein [Actinoplanes globisporus]
MSHTHEAPKARTPRLLAAVLIPAAVATLVAMIVLWPGHVKATPAPATGERALGTVTAIAGSTATVRVTDGPGQGTETTVDVPAGPGAPELSSGDDVVLLYAPDAVPGGHPYTVVDHQRAGPTIWLALAAVLAVLAFGRRLGLTSLAGLAVSFAILLLFVVPAILDGENPLLVAVVGSAAIMFAVLYLTHGFSAHTSVAVAGTLASLVLTGLLGAGFIAALHLTGVAGDDDAFLAATRGNIDMRGLLLAGIVIGALGVLDDVTVTQAAAVAELAPATTDGLYRAASRIGRAHVASAVNTLVLAYAGASLPLILLLATDGRPAGQVLTGELLAQEVLRSAVGTIGLVASVPITTALAVAVARNRSAGPRSSRRGPLPRHSRT